MSTHELCNTTVDEQCVDRPRIKGNNKYVTIHVVFGGILENVPGQRTLSASVVWVGGVFVVS